MQCKFLQHGISVSYDHVVKPCCHWTYDADWAEQNHIADSDLKTWHQTPQVVKIQQELATNVWPANCQRCAHIEQQGRQDSGRGNSTSAYSNYKENDITLEIRPGSVCNFACQTCWPEASSRVAQYHHQAGLINIKTIDSTSINDFEFLLPITDRIRDVVLLGGEPFYDPSCQKFLAWAQKNLQASITMFTNGSYVDWDWVDAYQGKITMVFSIDAVGPPAEYVRVGTNWSIVHANFIKAQTHPKIQLRVNITTSVYNYHLIEGVIDLLTPQWPTVVSFGAPHQSYMRECVVPVETRKQLILSLERCIAKIWQSQIESGQQHNAVNAIQSIINNLKQLAFDVGLFQQLRQFVKSMDQVKRVNVVDSANPVDFA
jgi:sulfatase maturation enzyme AslB (radical SAM superfamily)